MSDNKKREVRREKDKLELVALDNFGRRVVRVVVRLIVPEEGRG